MSARDESRLACLAQPGNESVYPSFHATGEIALAEAQKHLLDYYLLATKGVYTMHRLPALRVRFAELAMMRREHQALGKTHLVGYIDQLLADVEREIHAIERTAPPKAE